MKKIPNWKTSTCGVVVALSAAIAPMLQAPWQAVAFSIGTLATSLGLVFANDARKTKISPDHIVAQTGDAESPANPAMPADTPAGE